MLEELKKVREAFQPTPALPPLPKPEGFENEFAAFREKRGVIGLALAVIIGGAAGQLVSALVSEILMPVVTSIPEGGWREADWVSVPSSYWRVISLIVFVKMRQLDKTVLM